MNQPITARSVEPDRAVGSLTSVTITQVVVLRYLLPALVNAVFIFLILLPVLAFTHRRIPALARRCGRLFSWASDALSSPTPDADGATVLISR